MNLASNLKEAFIILAVLKQYVDLTHQLIGAEGTKTPVGVRFRGDPAGVSDEEARRNAHGKRSAWSGNQQASKFNKAFLKRSNKFIIFC
jgi:hypothetical protein